MFLIKRESQLNNYGLILFLKLVDVLTLERVPNHLENSQTWRQHFPLLFCDHWNGKYGIWEYDNGRTLPILFSILKGEMGVMVVREDVGARGLWEWRCLKERQKLEIGDPVISRLRIKESYLPPQLPPVWNGGQRERYVSGKVILWQWLVKSITKLISS